MKQIIDAINDRLATHFHNGFHPTVIENGVKLDGDMWIVPVLANGKPESTFDYYHELSIVEEEVESHTNAHILLVPAGPA